MSEIKYGLISKVDSGVIEKTLRMIHNDFSGDGFIHTTEIGVFDGDTSRGIVRYLNSMGRYCWHTSIDSQKDFEVKDPFSEISMVGESRFIIGNSNEVYNQLKDESQHLIFQDANHSYPSAIQDFFCYMRKVKIGGYMAWHDVAPQAQEKDWQRMGSQEDKDMYISIRKALTDIGLFDNKYEGWEFVMEGWDDNDAAGGVCVFKRNKR